MPKVSCLIVDDEAVARDIIAMHLAKIERIEIVAQCTNAVEAFNAISKKKVDLVFLDINMPEISGIAFAKSINKDIKVIFTTAYRDYAVEGFDLQAVDYLLKPIAFERLLKAVNRYFEVTAQSEEKTESQPETNDFIFVRSDRRMIKIDFDAILYIESYSDYLKIHLDSSTTHRQVQHGTSIKNDVIVTRETISAMEAKLPIGKFIRIHRSYIVSLSKIQSFNGEHVTVNRLALPFSRSYKKVVLKVLGNY